ncbi:cyclic nucleotide-binding domain-containing protein [Brachyspira hyodysenteriae]|uniref:cAMP-binding protein n=1 Tax=Brachyspira hyodysenteriae (strain ATCC 49526 / WA1) TaxID=565034 RepID=A0A3B6VE08_BRAHW|nr:cyclic nucleotide-binding domain-containing protein [Brachyspira hyodysenteriae]ACN85097.1 cAMP-binding protein [Brachyspira hyodysenteriae WA1]KLI39780.1 cAMP-binding protein [Brachyspira hyodysenteriae]KLI41265.1 cAMP-binding protein [Brachyspira hyodysenteriae]
MNKYSNLNFKKSSIIFIKDQSPKDTFYIITKGKAISYGALNYSVEFKKGDILGLINTVLNEPYFYNIKALEDMEVMELNLNEIINTKNKDLTVKIYKYLNASLETWLGRYYLLISESKEIIKGKTKEEILNMAHVYRKNGFDHAAYKLYNEYLKRFPDDDDENINDIKEELSNIEPIDEPLEKKDNVFHYKKGYCLYTELEGSDKLYIIKSGKIGIYNVVNLHQITRSIYSKNNIIDGYNPVLEYQPLSTSAIVLEDSVIKVLKKEELLSIIENDNSIKLYYIKMLSMKIRNTILKIIAINTDDISAKLLITLYYIVKTEKLPKNIDYMNLPYKINDIKTILNLKNDEIIKKELNKIKSISISDDDHINITDIKSFMIEYKNAINRVTNMYHHT